MPATETMTPSAASILRSWRLVIPSARSKADSLTRSRTDSESVLARLKNAING